MRNVGLDLIIINLEELSSKDLQYKYWVEGHNKLFSSYTEAVCQVFDDSGLGFAMDKGYFQKNNMTDIDNKLKIFLKLVNKISDNEDPEILIEKPIMNEIRSQALILMEDFVELKSRGVNILI